MPEMKASMFTVDREVVQVVREERVVVEMTKAQAGALMALLHNGVRWSGEEPVGEAAWRLYGALSDAGVRQTHRLAEESVSTKHLKFVPFDRPVTVAQ